MTIWYDFVNDRIGAMYLNCSTTSTKWEDMGYIRFDDIEPFMKPMAKPPVEKIPATIIKGTNDKDYVFDGNTIKEKI